MPRQIGPYRIAEVLGRGGMGVVYKARDAALERWVALKTLLPALVADTEARQRFLREARSAAALNHPNLAQIYAIGEQGGVPYFAMEFIEGETLAQMLERERRLPPLEAIRLVRQVALGLQEAHHVQLIHRDIKPANLILARDGTLKITDFGLAKLAQGAASVQLTQTGEAIGSPQYMSPEQARGAAVDHRCDIYSLGATFFHLLTGRPPFLGASPMEVAMKHIQEPVPSPRSLVPAVSYPLAGLVQRMLRKRREDRHPNYAALIEDLNRVEEVQTGKASGGAVPVWVQEQRKLSWPHVLGLLCLCAAAALIGLRLTGVLGGSRSSSAASAQGGPFSVERAGTLQAPAGEARHPGRTRMGRGEGAGSLSAGRRRAERLGLARERRRQLEQQAVQGEPRLRLLDLSRGSSESGTLIVGRVVNEGDATASGVRIEVNAFDDSGDPLGTQQVTPGRDTLESGAATRFEAFFPDLDGIARVEAELSWSY